MNFSNSAHRSKNPNSYRTPTGGAVTGGWFILTLAKFKPSTHQEFNRLDDEIAASITQALQGERQLSHLPCGAQFLHACNTSKTPKPSVDIETRQGLCAQTKCRVQSLNVRALVLLTTYQAMFKRLSPASNTTERDIYICRFTCHEQIYICKLLFLFPYSLLYIINNSSKLGLSFLFNPLFTLINNTINRRFYCGY